MIEDLDLLRSPGNPRTGDVGLARYAARTLPRMMRRSSRIGWMGATIGRSARERNPPAGGTAAVSDVLDAWTQL